MILPGGADLLGGTNLVRAEIPFGGNAVCTVNPYSYRVDTPPRIPGSPPLSRHTAPAANPASATGTREDQMAPSIAWNQVSRDDVVRAIAEYDRLGAEQFFAEHGFAPATTYELIWAERRYPPKAILGTAYEFATGQRLASGDFEGGKAGAVKVLGSMGFTVQHQ